MFVFFVIKISCFRVRGPCEFPGVTKNWLFRTFLTSLTDEVHHINFNRNDYIEINKYFVMTI